MFNFIVENELIENDYTYLYVNFYDGDENYIDMYRVWNNNKDMEIQTLKDTQIQYKIDFLNELKLEYGSIYDKNGELNKQKII